MSAFTRRGMLGVIASGATLAATQAKADSFIAAEVQREFIVFDTKLFLELSALLTGEYQLVTAREEVRKTLIEPIAREYERRLMGVFYAGLPALIDAYRTLSSTEPKPPIDDALLERLRQIQGFIDNEFIAKQIINIWYFSQFQSADSADAATIDGGRYQDGLVWPLVKAHPIGFSDQPHGYWASLPKG